MHSFIKWLYLMALIAWVGEIVFFSFVGAPSLFRSLPTADAGRAVGAIFPTYYRIGYACGAILVVVGLLLLGGAASRLWWGVNTALAAAMLALTLYAGLLIQPRAAALRPQIHDPSAPQSLKDEFGRLHSLAVTLNGAVLICGIAVSAITASSLRP